MEQDSSSNDNSSGTVYISDPEDDVEVLDYDSGSTTPSGLDDPTSPAFIRELQRRYPQQERGEERLEIQVPTFSEAATVEPAPGPTPAPGPARTEAEVPPQPQEDPRHSPSTPDPPTLSEAATVEPTEADVTPQPQQDPQHSLSTSGLQSSTVPPRFVQLPIPSEFSQAGSSVRPPEGAGPSVAAGVSDAVAGPSSTSASPLSKKLKRKHEDAAPSQACEEDEDEGQTCPICFEPLTNMGDHRIASLKCGHLFGFECINKWLHGTKKKQKGRCPQCNDPAAKRDVRIIYAKSIKVLDTTEKERILKELEKEREDNRRLDLENKQIQLKYEMKNKEVGKMQKMLKELKASLKEGKHSRVGSSMGEESSSPKKRLVLNHCLEVCREGGCRVMAYNEWHCLLVVSMPSQVGMFPGFGIKKINLLMQRIDQYVPLHQKQIRDLAFNPVKHDLLLSVGIDRLAKITNICSNNPVAQFGSPDPLWCCCWSITETHMFYVGTASGRLLQYDTRNTAGPTATIELPGSGPAVSMTYIQPGPESSLTWGGLLVARIQSCFFVEVGMPGEARSHHLPLDGTFTSVSCEANTCHVLVSCRPSQRYPHARHIVCQLQQVTREGEGAQRAVTTYPLHIFNGGTTQKVLTRSLLARLPYPNSSLQVYASDESSQAIFVWDLSTMTELQQLQPSETVVQLLQVMVGQTPHLAALFEKGVKMYCWTNP